MADATAELSIKRVRTTTDLATIIGMVTGFLFVIGAIFIGGAPGSFFNPPSILIVIGGTFAVTTACFSLKEMRSTLSVVMQTITYSFRDPADAAVQVLKLSYLARKEGVLALQKHLDSIKAEPFLHKGLSMIVDGNPGKEVEAILRREMHSTVMRHSKSTSVLRKLGEFAPAMGLIGTLIGLVQMLANLDDPSSIGPAMAVALLTTFYGAVLANMVFLPLASKLERNSSEETIVNNIYLIGVASVGRKENPRRLEMLINSLLPPSQRIRYFD
ncbi:MAG: MotA/TolQ/ExbB proton channel family protein [Pseudomonadota bacterium]|nr:MotA/TolQ/ExbB proton channel family protein [Pseudomonadota bacterium]|tara:strand:- start:236 stop:1051 length:816 start_codon:yes stop_codon:yes gene_type:complete